jgi:hypothetical protein
MPGARHLLGRRVTRDLTIASGVALAVTLVVCGRSLGHGLYLYRDFVTVPDPVWGAQTWGGGGGHAAAPRAVPLDPVMTALARWGVSTGLQQQVLLVGAVLLAGLGVAVLLRRHGLAAMTCGAVVAIWNPFVAERLLVGQPPTLLAYSMTPWLVAAVRSDLTGAKARGAIVLAAAPAALTPWGGVMSAAIVLVASWLTPIRRTAGWLGSCGAVAGLWCLPWALPALTGGAGAADPDGAPAFALASDSPLGSLGSALTLGGIWAPGAWPGSRRTVLAVVASYLLLAWAAAGALSLARRGRRDLAAPLTVAWLVPVLATWGLSTGPGLAVFAQLQAVPGLAIARDTHRWLGLSATAAAVLIGLATAGVGGGAVRSLDERAATSSRRVRVVAALGVAASLAVLSVPDLPRAVAAAYRPQPMPADWGEMVTAAQRAAGDGTVLVLPWQPFRLTTWAGQAPFLDPLPRALSSRVLAAHELTAMRGGIPVTVDDDPSALRPLAAGQLDLAELRRRDVRAVVLWKGTPGRGASTTVGLRLVWDSEHFTVWAVTRGT